MGNCFTLAASKTLRAAVKTPAIMPAAASNPDGDGVVKVIHAVDGGLQEFRRPVVAGQVVGKNPHCFLCNSEWMQVDFPAPSMADDEVLQTDQIYFLMPLATSQAVLSLTDLCELAIKAGVALKHKQPANTEKEGSALQPF